MDGTSPQIHVLSSSVGDLLEGKREAGKTKPGASLKRTGGAGMGFLLKRHGNTG
jgi:hypothetical protein